MRKFFALALLISSVSTFASRDVIYGEDNRWDLYNYPNKSVVSLASSVITLFKVENVSFNRETNQVTIRHTTAASNNNFCSWERFKEQPVSAFCSGFLIAPNKIVTAGHCIQSKKDCDNTILIFDYKMANKDQYYGTFGLSYVHACKRILGQVKVNGGVDFAVIELDRPTSREPLKLSTNENLQAGSDVFVIGNPTGMPTKIADNAVIRNIFTTGYFTTNLDTYGGNSGSAVFNAKTMEVEGILVRGETDFVTNQGCVESNYLSNTGGRGEQVSLISKIHELGVLGDYTRITKDEKYRYIWFSWFKTCNEFLGDTFVREVDSSYCAK